MMGKQDAQIQMVILVIDSMIPENHLLRQIKNCVNFDFIYEKAAPYYSNVGRKSIDPVILMKMLLIGYLYGIKSERRLEEEISLNLAYRWFCDIDFMQKVPDHSIFSQNRRRRFKDSGIFREIFNKIVLQCILLLIPAIYKTLTDCPLLFRQIKLVKGILRIPLILTILLITGISL